MVQGNRIGTSPDGKTALPNGVRILMASGARNNRIGGVQWPVEGNLISGNTGRGVLIRDAGTSGNQLLGNFIGSNFDGSAALPNGDTGVEILAGAANNQIGGTTGAARNLIAGNKINGVSIHDAATTGNVVQGNFIGTDAAGARTLPGSAQVDGISLQAPGNRIGGTEPGAGNLISGNGFGGIDENAPGSGNRVEGNRIGTDVSGLRAVPNRVGIGVSAGNILGGTAPGAGNLIAGNSTYGVRVVGDGSVIQGNVIGLDVNGRALPNQIGVQIHHGATAPATNNLLGGPGREARNVISGNQSFGVVLEELGTTGNVVQGNYIGTNSAGTGAVPNGGLAAVMVRSGAANNRIGGPGAGNLVSGNTLWGILVQDPGSTGNRIEGNFVGTNAAGTAELPNGGDGVLLTAPNNTVGGTAPGAGNLLSGNLESGVAIYATAPGCVVQGNRIGTDFSGSTAVGNHSWGVYILAPGLVGGAGTGNLISGNGLGGVILDTGCVVQGNEIGTNLAGTAAVPNGTAGVPNLDYGVDVVGPGNQIGGVGPAGNLISGNQGAGVLIERATATFNRVQGNRIGTNAAGTGAVPNTYGVQIAGGAANNVIGGTTVAVRNVISGQIAGVYIVDAGSAGNQILNNYIGTTAAGTGAVGNDWGIWLEAPSIIGAPGAGNVISGSRTAGVVLSGGSNGTLVRGNRIGTNAGGTGALPNRSYGIWISTSGNVIGGTTAGAGNVISASSFGVELLADGDTIQGNLIGLAADGAAACRTRWG